MPLLFALLLLYSGIAWGGTEFNPDDYIRKDTIFDGDIRGPFNKLIFKSTSAASTTTTIVTKLPKNAALVDTTNEFALNQYFARSIGIGTDAPQWGIHVVANSSVNNGPLGIYNAAGTKLASIDSAGTIYTNHVSSATQFALNPTIGAMQSRWFIGGADQSLYTYNAGYRSSAWAVDVSTRVGALFVLRADDFPVALTGHTVMQLTQISTPSANTIDLLTFDYNTGKMYLGTSYYTGSGKLNVDGNIATSAGKSYYIGSDDINTAGTLSNVAYENQINYFTNLQFLQDASNTAGTYSGIVHYKSGRVAQSGDQLAFYDYEATGGRSAIFEVYADAAHSGTSTPGRMVWSTTPAGSTGSTERMRLTSAGYLGIGSTAPATKLHLSSGAITLDGTGNYIAGSSATFTAGSFTTLTAPVGGDLSGYLPNPSVVDDSHNHHANSLYDVFLATQSVWDLPSSTSTISHNAGVLLPVNITDATGVAIALSSSTVLIRDNANWTGQLYYRYVAANSSLALTDNAVNFVYITWNGGTPVYGATTDRGVINNSDYVPIARVYMEGGNIEYQLLNGNIGLDLTVQGYDRVMRIRGQQGFEKESGLTVSCSSTSPNIAAGYLFFGYRRMTMAAYSVATEDNMYIYTHSGGNWIETKTASINNSYYDNGTSTVALTANRYAINYLFRRVSESTNELDIVVGTGDYTLAQAEAAVGTIPTIPQSFTYFYYPVGAIIIQNGATTPTLVVTYSPSSGVTFASAVSHSDLLDLGLDTHEQYALLAGRGGQTFDDNIHVNGSFVSSTSVTAPEFCIGLITPDCITAWPSSGGGNAYTTGGVVGELAYYTDTATITASGIQPSQILTSTNTRVMFRDVDNNVSATQTFQSSMTVNGIIQSSGTLRSYAQPNSMGLELFNQRISDGNYFSSFQILGGNHEGTGKVRLQTVNTQGLTLETGGVERVFISPTGAITVGTSVSTTTFPGWIDVGYTQVIASSTIAATSFIAACPSGYLALSCHHYLYSGTSQAPVRLYSRLVDCYGEMGAAGSVWAVIAGCVRMKY